MPFGTQHVTTGDKKKSSCWVRERPRHPKIEIVPLLIEGGKKKKRALRERNRKGGRIGV